MVQLVSFISFVIAKAVGAGGLAAATIISGRVSDIDGSPSSHRWSYSMRCRAADGDTANMAIFHYITKSKQEYMQRKVTDTRYPKGNVDLERKYLLEQQHTNCTRDNRASSL